MPIASRTGCGSTGAIASSSMPWPPANRSKRLNNNSQNGQGEIVPRQTKEGRYWSDSPLNRIKTKARNFELQESNSSISGLIIVALTVMGLGLILDNIWLGVSGSVVALLISLKVIFQTFLNLCLAAPEEGTEAAR